LDSGVVDELTEQIEACNIEAAVVTAGCSVQPSSPDHTGKRLGKCVLRHKRSCRARLRNVNETPRLGTTSRKPTTDKDLHHVHIKTSETRMMGFVGSRERGQAPIRELGGGGGRDAISNEVSHDPPHGSVLGTRRELPKLRVGSPALWAVSWEHHRLGGVADIGVGIIEPPILAFFGNQFVEIDGTEYVGNMHAVAKPNPKRFCAMDRVLFSLVEESLPGTDEGERLNVRTQTAVPAELPDDIHGLTDVVRRIGVAKYVDSRARL
jgi:hypothetical protein